MSGSGTRGAPPSSPAPRRTSSGNASAASTSTDNTVIFDNIAPTVTINQAAGQADPTNGSPILFTVAFSEAVTGFAASDVSFAGSTVGGTLAASVTGSGASYTVSVSGMTGSGTVVAFLVPGAAQDSSGNASAASTSVDNTVTFDAAAPTVTINQAAGQGDPTNGSPIAFTVVFSEPVSGFAASDVSLAGSTVGGTLAASVSGSGASYTVSVTGMTGFGIVRASIVAGAAQDGAGNSSAASTSSDNTVSFDNVAPTVTINQAPGQADPASGTPINFAVVFSEAVTGFTGSDVSFAGSTGAGTLVASVSGSGATYTVSVTGLSGLGTVVASIPAAAATDAVGNPSTASTSTDNMVTVTLTISRPDLVTLHGIYPTGPGDAVGQPGQRGDRRRDHVQRRDRGLGGFGHALLPVARLRAQRQRPAARGAGHRPPGYGRIQPQCLVQCRHSREHYPGQLLPARGRGRGSHGGRVERSQQRERAAAPGAVRGDGEGARQRAFSAPTNSVITALASTSGGRSPWLRM